MTIKNYNRITVYYFFFVMILLIIVAIGIIVHFIK
jgi:hypothetical protein